MTKKKFFVKNKVDIKNLGWANLHKVIKLVFFSYTMTLIQNWNSAITPEN